MEVVPKGSNFIEKKKKNQHHKRLRYTAITRPLPALLR